MNIEISSLKDKCSCYEAIYHYMNETVEIYKYASEPNLSHQDSLILIEEQKQRIDKHNAVLKHCQTIFNNSRNQKCAITEKIEDLEKELHMLQRN